jgi:hypothetical protein
MAGVAAATAIVAATEFAASLRDEALMPTVLGAALPAVREAMQAAHVETVALHAGIPAVREAGRVAAMLGALAAVVAMLAASAAVDMAAALAAAVDMAAAAAIGKRLRLSSKRLVCFGRRAFLWD